MLGCQDEVRLVANLHIKGMPGCCPRHLVGVESVGKGESMALCELEEPPSAVVCLSDAKLSYCPCPVLVGIRAYFDIPIALNCNKLSSSWAHTLARLSHMIHVT